MRIVGGMWRNRSIEAPRGRGTRPTTDRMRESMASMVLAACELDLEGRSVLDAFAGSGAIGLELLSRGASSCTFYDTDARAARLVRENCKRLGADPLTWRVVRGDVTKCCSGPMWGSPFSIVVLDPPYATDALVVAALVEELRRGKRLADGCLIMYEHDQNSAGIELGEVDTLKSKRMASSRVDLLRVGV